jgi:hypothetical protein
MKTLWRSVIPIVVVLSLVVLAAGISRVSFLGTRYGPPSEPSEESSSTLRTSPQDGQSLAPLLEQVVSLTAIALVLFGIVVSLLRPKSLWEAIKRVLPAALWFAAILLILLRWRDRPFFKEPKGAPAGVGTVPAEPNQHFPTLEQVHVPSWITFLFVLGVLLVIGVMIFVAWRLWRARTRTTPIEELADLTRRYAQELRYGAPVHETILRCYREMCQLLSERFHLEISRAMTTREFEKRLAQIGVLEEHIVRLSRLFEWARYSPARPTPEQEREALQLLEEITQIYGRREVFQTA